MCLAGSGRAKSDDVGTLMQEVELAEMLDHLLLRRALEGEVELLQRLAGREPGGLDPPLAAVTVAGGDLREAAPGWRVASAIRSASSTRSVRMCVASCQPTIIRENTSITNARNMRPSHVRR